MLPYNMTRSDVILSVSGGILVSISVCLFYLIFGKLMTKTSMIKQLLSFKFTMDFAIRMTVLTGIIFIAAFLRALYHEHFTKFWPFDQQSFEK